MNDSNNDEVGKRVFIGGGSMLVTGTRDVVGDPPGSLSFGAIGSAGGDKKVVRRSPLDQLAEQLLADEEFLDQLYEKMRARGEAKAAKSAQALSQAALEGARLIREKMYGPETGV